MRDCRRVQLEEARSNMQVLGQGGAFEKTKGRAGMEFDEHRPWLEEEDSFRYFFVLDCVKTRTDCQRRLTKN